MEVNLVITYDISEDSIEVNLVIRFFYLHAVPDIVPDKVLITKSISEKNCVLYAVYFWYSMTPYTLESQCFRRYFYQSIISRRAALMGIIYSSF